MTLTPARLSPPPRGIAAMLAAGVLATLIGTLVVPSGASQSTGNLLAGLALMSMVATTAAVGLLIAWHQPANPIGWLLPASSLLYLLGLNAALEPAHLAVQAAEGER